MSSSPSRRPDETPSPRAERAARAVAPLLTIVLAFVLVNGGRLRANFARPQWEDRHFIEHVRRNIHSVGDVFARGSYWKGFYRPLSTNLFYYLGEELFHSDPHAHHVALFVFYVANAWFLYWFCLELLPPVYATLACVLFVTRAANVEVPLFASQFQTILPATFSFGALKLYGVGLRHGGGLRWLAASLVSLVLGLLSKESVITMGVVLALLFVLQEEKVGWGRSRSHAWRTWSYLGLPLAVTAIWAALFTIVLVPRVVGHQDYWEYVFSLRENTAALVSYLLSDSNLLARPIRVVDGIIFLTDFPRIIWLSHSAVLQAMALLAVAVATVVLTLARRLPFRAVDDLRVVAWAFLWCVLSLLPVLFFKNRLLMYYAHVGTAALSIAVAATMRMLGARARPLLWGLAHRALRRLRRRAA